MDITSTGRRLVSTSAPTPPWVYSDGTRFTTRLKRNADTQTITYAVYDDDAQRIRSRRYMRTDSATDAQYRTIRTRLRPKFWREAAMPIVGILMAAVLIAAPFTIGELWPTSVTVVLLIFATPMIIGITMHSHALYLCRRRRIIANELGQKDDSPLSDGH